MALRVGVTGHRNLDAGLIAQLRPLVREVLKQIRDGADQILQDSKSAWSAQPPLLRALSPLAEGADRLFAEEALDLGFTLVSPLPFHRAEYENDFHASPGAFRDLLARAESVLELNGDRVDAAAAYEAVGHVVLDQCDLLISLWDGRPARGKGGTEEIRAEALKCRLPVVTIYTAIGETAISTDGAAEVPFSGELLHHALRRILFPPWLALPPGDPLATDPDVTGHYRHAASGKSSFLGWLWAQFIVLITLGCKLDPRFVHETAGSPFLDLYDHFDAIANRFAGLYRGAFLASYLLGVCAVFLALLSYAAPSHAGQWLLGELAAVVVSLLLILAIRRRRWHYRSVDCRYLAEQFRILCYLHPLGLSAPLLRLPAHHLHTDVRKSWMEWLLRATIRATSMPAGVVDANYVSSHAAEIIDGWIPGQIAYHTRNYQRMHCAEKRSERLVWISAGLAGLACVLHFVFHEPCVVPWLTLCAAGCPAASAAFHAIATQGEFRRLGDRSGAMARSLKGILDGPLKNFPPNLASLRREARQTAELMIDEVVDWQILYRKPVEP